MSCLSSAADALCGDSDGFTKHIAAFTLTLELCGRTETTVEKKSRNPGGRQHCPHRKWSDFFLKKRNMMVVWH